MYPTQSDSKINFLGLSEEEVKKLKKKITEMEDEHSTEINRYLMGI